MVRFLSWIIFMFSHYFTRRSISGMSNVVRRVISSPLSPHPVGPFSQAVLINNTLYISGQLGMDRVSGNIVEGGAAVETQKALENMGHILEAAGANYNSVVKSTILLADMDDFASVNEVYKNYFKNYYPASAAYQVAALPKGGKVEIEAVAIVGNIINLNI
uniref:2-iminobutanoate/2-iminopropanoate deaminase n=1 Tax=Strigamia maritima TaxID=126957 RepID=T1II18_STRMM